ncbi:hypothetical protein NMY22_g17801 [Coprinellus aureogranulatus]|nr:hypothetical protein NMY22_g17801 [Coprinellus aureogranulatus]
MRKTDSFPISFLSALPSPQYFASLQSCSSAFSSLSSELESSPKGVKPPFPKLWELSFTPSVECVGGSSTSDTEGHGGWKRKSHRTGYVQASLSSLVQFRTVSSSI